MTLLSGGLYIFYWFYLTWKHYRDSTGDEAYPVWHALTLFVLIYGFFRTHAHMRVYKELMTRQGLLTTISPRWAVLGVIGSWIFSSVLGYSPLTADEALAYIGLFAASTAIIVWLLVHVQSNLNRYWSHVYDRVDSTGFSIIEVILGLFGAFIWADAIASVVSESYRLAP